MRWILFLAVAVSGGCTMGDANAPVPASLDAGRWTLVEVDGRPAEANGWLEINLEKLQVNGSSGCNDFRTTFKGTPEAMKAGPIGSTKKLCPDPLMAQERRVFEILQAASAMSVDDDGYLKITGTRGFLRAAGPAVTEPDSQ